MRVPLVLLGLVVHIRSECDLFEEALTLNCVSPLVSYANPSQTALHPALSEIDRHCRDYNSYLLCTAGVRTTCRASRAGHVEKMYGMMCEDKYLAIVREERDCLLDLERDQELRQCFLNRTNILRDETASRKNSFSPATPPTSYECSVIQAYVDCLLEREIDSCSDAVKVEVSLLSLLATRDGSNCNLLTNNTRARPPPLEVCDRNNNCECRLPGYFFNKETLKCIDIDECIDVPCSQKCENTPGSFICTCDEQFYQLSSDNRTCIRKDEEPLWLFFAHGQSIWNISTDGKNYNLQRIGLQKTAMIDVDVQEKRLYYADIGAHVIARMNIEGAFSQDVQKQDVDGLEGIAVDWIARNLYSLRKTDILVQSLSGRFRKVLYRDSMRLPRTIVVHPLKGLMFVSDWSNTPFIAAAAMDGSSFKKIVTERLTWPNAITVDIHSDRIYWADAFLDIIEMANLDGSRRRTIVGDAGSVPHIFGMVVVDDFLYWTDWTYRGLLRAHKLSGENITVLAQTALLPYSIKAFHKSLQPPASTPCNDMGCSQLCLVGAGGEGGKCVCGEGFELDDDGKNCMSNCGRTEIECGGRDPKCISRLFLCDGVAHCDDREDEISCPPRICLPGQFQCHDSKKCLSPGGLCDAVADCADGSDEDFCPTR